MARSKFNVSKDTTKRTHNGITFDSELEMKYYRDVVLPLVEKGKIITYELQKKYELQPKFKKDGKTIKEISYVADFFLVYEDGHEEIIDTKGCPDNIALMKRKMFWYHYPTIDYKWMSYSKIDGGWIEYEELKKARKERKKAKQMIKGD